VSRVVAIGEASRLAGFTLAGVDVRGAEDTSAANAALEGLERDIALLILTPRAEAALRGHLADREDVVWVTLPD
jgi:vacuolar-type H+-ATPase subunit F/Vma7